MSKTVYVCDECGKEYPKWVGVCQNRTCGSRNISEKEKIDIKSLPGSSKPGVRAAQAATNKVARPVSEIVAQAETTHRLPVGINEVDRVLGGGLVPGSVILLAGPPGVGKSSVVLAIASQLAIKGEKVLYITGEETENQVASRALRIGAASTNDSSLGANLNLLSEQNLNNSIVQVGLVSPKVIIVDSLQTMLSSNTESKIGSISQVTEVATEFTQIAKRHNIPVILIGHVTKDGSIAGPRVVEHLVDTVLYFEASENSVLRLLRAEKNRYGSTDEIGCFEHTAEGLVAVDDPSSYFVNTHDSEATGYATSVTLEGRRALPIELQSLAVTSRLPNPRKITQGVEHGRSLMLQAVLDRYGHYNFADLDVYVSTTGGLRLNDPSTDLAIAAALISSRENRTIPMDSVFLGEVSLTGEVRQPKDFERRLIEARRLGFSKIYTLLPDKKSMTSAENVIHTPNIATLKHYISELS